MESVILDKMTHYLLSNNLLSDNQHGFLKKRSTLTNLLSSLRHWLTSLDSGRSTDVIYIDFAKAFDTVSHAKLLHKLTSYGIHGKLYDWIKAWLSGRTQSVRVGNSTSDPTPVHSGVMQGSVLGPLLFLLFINDLAEFLPADAHPTLFADDLKIFSDQSTIPVPLSSDNSTYCPLLQKSLDMLCSWSQLWQLNIAIPKCAILSISNSKSLSHRHYTINSIPLPQVTSCSDLGVTN
jgi:hypothetical protein